MTLEEIVHHVKKVRKALSYDTHIIDVEKTMR